MVLIEDREIEARLEGLGAHTAEAKAGLARQLLLQASERVSSARDQLSAAVAKAEAGPLLELTDELWEEIMTGPPRPEDLDRPLGLGVPPELSAMTLRAFLAGSRPSR